MPMTGSYVLTISWLLWALVAILSVSSWSLQKMGARRSTSLLRTSLQMRDEGGEDRGSDRHRRREKGVVRPEVQNMAAMWRCNSFVSRNDDNVSDY